MDNNKGQRAGIIGWAHSFPALPVAFAVLLAAIGVLGLMKMPRNEFPTVTVRQAMIIGIYPGATSDQVSDRIAKPVESFLFSFGEINFAKTRSFSRSGVFVAIVELNESARGPSIELFWGKLRGSLPQLQHQLPPGASPLVLKSDFGETATVLLAVESAGRDNREFSNYLDTIQDQLRCIPNLARIGRTGEATDELRVDVDREKMLKYGITREQLLAALKDATEVAPAGSLTGLGMLRPLRLVCRQSAGAELADGIIKVDRGNTIRLRDVANIYRTEPTEQPFVTNNGRLAAILNLEMAHGGNIVEFGNHVSEKLAYFSQWMPSDMHITKLSDQPMVVKQAVNMFLWELVATLVIVVVMLVLFLPLRVALIAAATIPVTMAATVGMMYILGFELNIVTLGAMLIVLGIVVDDPIVVIDNFLELLDQGKPAIAAAITAARRLFPSVLIATLIIGATFMPLEFFLTGLAADFIGEFPFTILIALGFSLAISMLIVPFACSRLIVYGLRFHPSAGMRRTFLERMQRWFDRKLELAMGRRRATLWMGGGIVVLGLLMMALLPLQLFPTVERDQFAIEVHLDQGSALHQTAWAVQKIESVMASDPRVKSYASFIGGAMPRFHATYAPGIPSENYAQILVRTKSAAQTEEVIADYQRRYSSSLANGYLRMKQLTMVSAVAPIEIRVSGVSVASMKRIGQRIVAIGRAQQGVVWPRTDYGQMREVINVEVDPERAAMYHLDRTVLAGLLNAELDGLPVSQVWEGSYSLPLVIGIDGPRPNQLSSFPLVTGPSTGSVPLSAVSRIRPGWEEGQIVRRNGIPTLTVLMDVAPGQNAIGLLDRMRDKISSIPLERGESISFGGEQELQDENLYQMIKALVTSVLVISLLLLYHFRHLKQTLLALCTIPLSIPGVGAGLTVLPDYLFGFTAFVGFLGACGLVVRNAMLLIDLADEYRTAKGMSPFDAAVLASKRRMRPIFLTTATASIAVVTMVASGSPLWGPMGTVICFGPLLSMVLTLFVLPALYSLTFRGPADGNGSAMVRPLYNHA